jgi:hypothetical protein
LPQAASSKTHQEDEYDALFLGYGSNDRDVAQRVLDMLWPSIGSDVTPLGFSLPAEEALALLHTAVEQHRTSSTHRQLLHMLVGYVPSVQHLAPSQLLPVVQRAMKLECVFDKRGCARVSGFETSLWQLDQLPAVRQIPSDALPGLLSAAMASGDSYSVSCVTSWSSFGKLEAEQLAELLEAAVQVEATHGTDICSYHIEQLLKVPSYRHVDAATITAAMLVVVKASSYNHVLQQLKQAGAAAHADVLLLVAMAGLKARNTYAVRCLLDLDQAGSEAANRFSAKDLSALLQAAIENGPGLFESL